MNKIVNLVLITNLYILLTTHARRTHVSINKTKYIIRHLFLNVINRKPECKRIVNKYNLSNNIPFETLFDRNEYNIRMVLLSLERRELLKQ